MKLHGHEIPEEFVREVEDVILKQEREFFPASIETAFILSVSGFRMRNTLGLGYFGWADLLRMIMIRVFNRFRKEGKIEYRGAARGWRVKR